MNFLDGVLGVRANLLHDYEEVIIVNAFTSACVPRYLKHNNSQNQYQKPSINHLQKSWMSMCSR